MEINFNLGSLKIVYDPLMEYFQKIEKEIKENSDLIHDGNLSTMNYQFIEVIDKTKKTLKMIGLNGVVSVLSLMQNIGLDLKNKKLSKEQEEPVWKEMQNTIHMLEGYLKRLLEGNMDEPTHLYSQYKKLADCMGKTIEIKDLFTPKLILKDASLQQKLKTGFIITEINKKEVLEVINQKQKDLVDNINLVLDIMDVKDDGLNLQDREERLNDFCGKIDKDLENLQKMYISSTYYISLGIERVWIDFITPLYNKDYNKFLENNREDLKNNLEGIKQNISNLKYSFQHLDFGDKSGRIKAEDNIAKENLYFIIKILNNKKEYKDFPHFKELVSYFDYQFYENELKDTTLEMSLSHSNPESYIQIEKAFLEAKEEWVLLTSKWEDQEFYQQHINKFYMLQYKFHNLIHQEEGLKEFSDFVLLIVNKLKDKEKEFSKEYEKELSLSMVLYEYAIELFFNKNSTKEEKSEFEKQLSLEKERLNGLLLGEDLSQRAKPVLDAKNKKEEEKKTLIKIYQEMNDAIELAENSLDEILRKEEVEEQETEEAFKKIKSVEGIFLVLKKPKISEILKKVLSIWKEEKKNEFNDLEKEELKKSIEWLSAIALMIKALNHDDDEAEKLEKQVIANYNDYYGIEDAGVFTKETETMPIQETIPVVLDFSSPVGTDFIIKEITPQPHDVKEIPLKENTEDKKEMPVVVKKVEVKENSMSSMEEDEANDEELLDAFIEEMEEVQENFTNSFAILDQNPMDLKAIVDLRRGFHTIKGSGRMVGLIHIGDLAWEVEQKLNTLINLKSPITVELLSGVKYMGQKMAEWTLTLKEERKVKIDVANEKNVFMTLIEKASHKEPETKMENPVEQVNVMEVKEDPNIMINGQEVSLSLYQLFMEESTKHLEELKNTISNVEHVKSFIIPRDFMRHAHTSASIAAAMYLQHFSDIAAKIEFISTVSLEQEKSLNGAQRDVLKYAIDNLDAFRGIDSSKFNMEKFNKIISDLDQLQNELNKENEIETVQVLETTTQEKPMEKSVEEVVTETIDLVKEQNKEQYDINMSDVIKNTIQKVLEENLLNINMKIQNVANQLEQIENSTKGKEIPIEQITQQVGRIVEEKYQQFFQDSNQKLLEKIKSLEDELKTMREHQEDVENGYKESVGVIRKDLRVMAYMLKKKSSESHQGIFWDEIKEKNLLSNEIIEDLESLTEDEIFELEQICQEIVPNDDIENHKEKLPSKNEQPMEMVNPLVAKDYAIDNEDNPYIQAIFEQKVSSVQDEIDQEIYEISRMEIDETYLKIEELLDSIKLAIFDVEKNNSLKRFLHTLKGSARMAGANKMGLVAHRLESVLDYSENHHIPLLEIKSFIEKEMEKIDFLKNNISIELNKDKENWLDNVKDKEERKGNRKEISLVKPIKENINIENTAKSVQAKETQYIRIGANMVDKLINEAGEMRLTRTALEGVLEGDKKYLEDLKNASQKIGKILKEIEVQAESQIAAHKDKILEEGKEFDPLELDRFTRLQELTRFMNEATADIKDTVDVMSTSFRVKENTVAQQTISTNSLLDSLMKVRLITADQISERLYKIARNTAKEMNKKVSLEITGESTEIDRLVLDRIQSPLEHLLRNSIAHGIETSQDRISKGKSSVGKVKLEIRQDANLITMTMEDDGDGIDLQKIEEIAYQKGLINHKNGSEKEKIELIFMPGLSTAKTVTQVAGRGVGMDVVKNEITSLGGEIKTETKKGMGTKFTIILPVSVATNQAMLTEVSHKLIAIPAVLVDQVLSMKKASLERAYEDGRALFNGIEYPLYYLGHLMNTLPSNQLPEIKTYNTLILISYLDQKMLVHVDKMETTDEILIKPVGAYLSKIKGLLGATLLGDGRQGMVINPVLLKDYYHKFKKNVEVIPFDKNPSQDGKTPSKKKDMVSVMVVDDSTTMRRAATKILEKYGYHIILAKDGEDALEKLQISIPSIILSDIEMPVMDGFEFLKNIKNIEAYKKIPVIMITSRTAEKHQNYAFSLGANKFLGKPYQEQELIQYIKELTHTL